MTVCDAHFHLVQVKECCPEAALYRGCSCAHAPEEFARQRTLAATAGQRILCSFGLHPQAPRLEFAPFLEQCLAAGALDAVGECGFDCFTPELRALRAEQDAAFVFCAEAALRAGLPLVVHDRKALDALFAHRALLARLPSVVFHSFAFGPREACSLLAAGINGYFSFGKALLNGNKKSAACVAELPADRLLFETDAPYQTLRGEACTHPSDIERVYRAAAALRHIPVEELCLFIEETYACAFLA